MFVNPLGGSGTPTFGGGRASPAASISRSPSRTPKDVVKSMNAAREAMIPKAVMHSQHNLWRVTDFECAVLGGPTSAEVRDNTVSTASSQAESESH